MRAALHQPDQPGNVGAILRLGACLGVPIDIIEPCGFAFSDRALKRAGMDYREMAELRRHESWVAFEHQVEGRIVLLTTQASVRLHEVRFAAGDILLFGSESGGVPADVHERADVRVRIPQAAGTRSLNIVVAAGIALGEALRQTGGFRSMSHNGRDGAHFGARPGARRER
jgi:tRNA (cytidine/uridine-2'-O-)-methyltransferase